jgi:hypothetical protein
MERSGGLGAMRWRYARHDLLQRGQHHQPPLRDASGLVDLILELGRRRFGNRCC